MVRPHSRSERFLEKRRCIFSTGIRTLGHPGCSESLYPLHYQGSHFRGRKRTQDTYQHASSKMYGQRIKQIEFLLPAADSLSMVTLKSVLDKYFEECGTRNYTKLLNIDNCFRFLIDTTTTAATVFPSPSFGITVQFHLTGGWLPDRQLYGSAWPFG